MAEMFFGIPIEGDITRGHRGRIEQRPKEELFPIFQDVFADPRVQHVVWTQHTPYFNDGEPCEFSVDCFGAVLEGIDYSDVCRWGESDPTHAYPDELTTSYSLSEDDPLKGKLQTLERTGGPFEDVYLELFGDHARIIASRDKFIVEYYEHD